MENKIRKMHFLDRSLIIAFIIFLWVVLISVMTVVSSLSPNVLVRLIAITVGIVAGLSTTSALIAVLGHLKRHEQELYSEDVKWSQLLKNNG